MNMAFAMGLMRMVAGSVAAIALSSCTDLSSTSAISEQDNSGPATEQIAQPDEPLEVVTTFLPMTDFAQAVAGDRAQVTQLLPVGVSPHDYQAKPQDAQRIAEADVLIKNGLAFENFLAALIENAGNADLAVVDTSAGIDPLSTTVEDEHTEADHADDHDHGGVDPHIWLDPKRAIQQVENIRDGLIAADPDGGDIYTDNAAAYISELQALDRDISEALAPYARKTFVTYHDFA
ncbi:MAG: zinc ABC transporter substrate-binding protein, partial [Phormidesmis sp.]